MKNVVNYFKSLFCTHNFEIEDTYVTVIGKCETDIIRKGEKRFIFCSKCGYHDNFWKKFK